MLLDSGVVASAIYVDNALVHIVYGVLCILKLNHVPRFVASNIKCNMFFSFNINLLINILETMYSKIIYTVLVFISKLDYIGSAYLLF